jgi:tetratricopeptide (TPR) repeat protein
MPSRPDRRVWLWPAVIALAAAVVYANSLTAPFIFDDLVAIVNNRHIRHPWPLWKAFDVPALAQPIVQRPVIALSLVVNYALGGLDVRGYHVFNLLVHIAAALALFGLVRRTLRLPRFAGRFDRAADHVAGASALLWATHPLLTECVTYVTQRTESLMALCYLTTLYCLVRGGGSATWARWRLLAVAACAVGMGSKQVMLTAPLAVLLYDRTFLVGSAREALRRRPWFYAGMAGTWVLLGALVLFGPSVDQTGFRLKHFSFLQNLATQPGVLLHYLRLALWPHPLVLDYAWPIARSPGLIAATAAPLLAWLAATLWLVRRRTAVGFVSAVVLLTLAPTSLWPMVTEIAAERRMYLPLAGLVVLAVAGAWRLLRAWPVPPSVRAAVSAGLLASLVLVSGTLTIRRNRDYLDPLEMWRKTVEQQPKNSRARVNFGMELAAAGHTDEALREYQYAVATSPRYVLAHLNLGALLGQMGRYEDALAHLHEARRLRPDMAGPYINLGTTAALRGNMERALKLFQDAVERDPENAEALTGLGAALERLGSPEEAIPYHRRAIAQQPTLVAAHLNVGMALAKTQQPEQALQAFARALALDPTMVDVWQILAGLQEQLGRLDDAAACYLRALEYEPKNAQVLARLNQVQTGRAAAAAAAQTDAAVGRAEAAVRDAPEDPSPHIALGDLLYERGRVQESLPHYREAVRLRPDDPQAHAHLAVALAGLGLIQEAQAEFDAAARLGMPGSPDAAGAARQ